MIGEEDLAVRQARDGLALGRELLGIPVETDPNMPRGEFELRSGEAVVRGRIPSCSRGDDAWHRAVSRLTRLPLMDAEFRRLLAEERERSRNNVAPGEEEP